ncbi:PP2C family protein-serine/threonine phosphatase [Streptacidiphilus jiangxiensis]|uniref:Stage II sporulation protein E (SpoIIE) n=1 Tax=Streptacidiphilus jiangxiensis TaxID=235985 RepID=A0A1H7ZVR8_STRJI|nr:PP2C family protein-serine/threonine phosphatase [Streptacidiphilus jiangxiensis]SEM62535.1 Stage II sporulation protein E (SpoIIE) [Streptacidiphilus jiangxiensis]
MSDEWWPSGAEPTGPAGLGERLLGTMLDMAQDLPPQLLAPLLVGTARRFGGRELSILLPDYGQTALVPLPDGGLSVGTPEPILGTIAGATFLGGARAEVAQEDGVRVYLPLSDSGNQVGVMALTVDAVDDAVRRMLHRFAGLAAGLLLAKNGYTDRLCQTRRLEPMSVAAEIQWSLLPPLSMSVPRVAVAGILEPAYEVAGDSFDYALNDHLLHVATIDAMGHGLDAATMATVAIGAYRHARRADIGLADIYSFMDGAIAEQFGPDHFVTAQMMRLDTETGLLEWVNAGHPAPLLIRDRVVVERLEGATTLPVGFGGEAPVVSERALLHGDQVLCFTDGLVEERGAGGEQFGEEQLIDAVNHVERSDAGVRPIVRALSHSLKEKRGGRTSDDATLFMIEWR